MSKVQYFMLKGSFTAWDRATAYGCARRGKEFDPHFCELMKQRHFALIDHFSNASH